MKKSSMLAVLMAVGTAGPVSAAEAVSFDRFGMVGLAAGQTARLNAVNTIGDPGILPCRVSLMFFDSAGGQLGGPDTRSLAPGKAAFVDIGDPGIRPGARFELRALVRKFDEPLTRVNECGGVIATVEVFDNATGRTAVFVGNPDQ